METITGLLSVTLNIELIQIIISSPRAKDGSVKIKVRPVEKKGTLLFQVERFTKTQVFHENLDQKAALRRLSEFMKEFRQMQIMTRTMNYNVLVSKKEKVTIQKKKVPDEKIKTVDLSHDRSKNYILKEGVYVPFLQDLGVMTKEGQIIKSKYDKFRQINRFLEFIEDILPQLSKDREVTILDFGCGKSYLTFAMYYYLHELKHYDVRIIGLDLKKEVIEHCSQLAENYKYRKLAFKVGDIADYEELESVDMVVTLHACDTATDYALSKAVGWGANVILSVPCCQHELNSQMENEILAPIMKYGLLKERFAALATDGLRAEYLESVGYDSQVLEFIEMEHTSKNILIRAVKKRSVNKQEQTLKQIQACEEFLHVSPTLGNLFLKKEGDDD